MKKATVIEGNGQRVAQRLNGHGPAHRRGQPVRLPSRVNGAACPKCGGLVLVRRDLYLGVEPYCVNCGWTQLTSLDAHRPPDAELRAMAALRASGRCLAQGWPREREASWVEALPRRVLARAV